MNDPIASVNRTVINSLRDEIIARRLIGGKLPADYAVSLYEAFQLLERRPGATHTELYRDAVKIGAKASGMQWRLACLVLIGIARIGPQRNGTETWVANN